MNTQFTSVILRNVLLVLYTTSGDTGDPLEGNNIACIVSFSLITTTHRNLMLL